jgi:hypothetical protein
MLVTAAAHSFAVPQPFGPILVNKIERDTCSHTPANPFLFGFFPRLPKN